MACACLNRRIMRPYTYRDMWLSHKVEQREAAGALSAMDGDQREPVALRPLVVVPTYNERENLEAIVRAIREQLPRVEILIIDDGSPDGTGDIAESLAASLGGIHVIHRPGKMGLGTAYVTGFRFALEHDYTCVFEMDADFSHDPRFLPDLLAAAERYDMVIGSRYVPGGATPDWKLIRRIISGGGNVFARTVLSLPIHDCTAGFKCYRRSVIAAFDLDRINLQGYAFQIETVYQAYKAGFSIGEVPIVFPDRRLGQSKMSRQIVAEAFTYVVKRRLDALRAR
ncbi:MAG: polyprenol monophosphomannose synthase [Chloroflexi bacterium]|nr:polyprenol monophosphomannose synthase [Chloroflexota bacterium]